ncbi:MAG: DUF6164 family protein [Pseudohongiellaceae bacterium]
MSKLLFNLRGVPDDEADEVRGLLDEHGIAYYETSAGLLGISLAALWLVDKQDFPEARRLLDDYQQERVARMRSAYEMAQQRGEAGSLWHLFMENPLRFIGCILLIGVILYFSLRFYLPI